jgi:hypothetical protein
MNKLFFSDSTRSTVTKNSTQIEISISKSFSFEP